MGSRGFLRAGCARAVLIVVLMLGAEPGAARGGAAPDEGDQEAQAYYGAIAYSPSTRSHGWSYDYGSRREAERRALDQCNRLAAAPTEDCVVPVWFRNACGALAIGADGYGAGWGASSKAAETFAIQSCARYSGGCVIIRSLCTTQ